MALIDCPECVQQVSDSASQCPHCGFTLIGKKSGGFSRGVGRLLVILVGLFILIFIYSLVSPSDVKNKAWWAIDEGKKSLEANLKDPSSVEYGEVWAARMKAKPEDKGILVACGTYNARNGFGGMTGQKRFIGSPGNIVLTDELNGGVVLNTIWSDVCVRGRIY
ncbi:MAG TPA: hypothetical protein VGK97_04855 [Spongiibacteraceae bacterium]|jgi:hypothetical protein